MGVANSTLRTKSEPISGYIVSEGVFVVTIDSVILCKEDSQIFYEKPLKSEAMCTLLDRTDKGDFVYVGCVDGSVYIYRTSDGTEEGTIPAYPSLTSSRDEFAEYRKTLHDGPINCMAFTEFALSRKVLLTGSEDGTIKMWSLDGKIIHTFVYLPITKEQPLTLNSLPEQPQRLPTKGKSPVVENLDDLSDTDTCDVKTNLEGQNDTDDEEDEEDEELSEEEDEQVITEKSQKEKECCGLVNDDDDDDDLHLSPILTPTSSLSSPEHVDLLAKKSKKASQRRTPVTEIAVDEKHGTLFAGYNDGKIVPFTLATGAQPFTIAGHSDVPVDGLLMVNDVLVSTADDDTLRLWNPEQGDEIKGYRLSTTALAFDKVRNLLICATWEGKVCITKLISTLGEIGDEEMMKEFRVTKRIPISTPEIEQHRSDDQCIILDLTYDTKTDSCVVCLCTNEILVLPKITQIEYDKAIEKSQNDDSNIQYDQQKVEQLLQELKTISTDRTKQNKVMPIKLMDVPSTAFEEEFIKNCIRSLEPQLESENFSLSDLIKQNTVQNTASSQSTLSPSSSAIELFRSSKIERLSSQKVRDLVELFLSSRQYLENSFASSKREFLDDIYELYDENVSIIDPNIGKESIKKQYEKEKAQLLERHRQELAQLEHKYLGKMNKFQRSHALDKQRLAHLFSDILEDAEDEEKKLEKEFRLNIRDRVMKMMPVIGNKYVIGNPITTLSKTTYRGVTLPDRVEQKGKPFLPLPVIIKAYPTAFVHSLRADLHHPGLVELLDICKTKDAAYVVLKEVDNTLAKLLKDHTQELSSDVICSIMYPIIEALAYLHKNNLVHRELRPGTIFIDQDSTKSKGTCTIGCAKVIHVGIMRALTGVEACENGMYFSAPEVFAKTVVTASDAWSVGCLLLYLFQTPEERSKPLFTGANGKEVLQCMKEFFGIVTPAFAEGIAAWCKMPADGKDLFIESLTTNVETKTEDESPGGRCDSSLPLFSSDTERDDEFEFTANDETETDGVGKAIFEDDLGESVKQTEDRIALICHNAPPEAVNLIALFLRLSPRNRLLCSQALKHPFFARWKEKERKEKKPTSSRQSASNFIVDESFSLYQPAVAMARSGSRVGRKALRKEKGRKDNTSN